MGGSNGHAAPERTSQRANARGVIVAYTCRLLALAKEHPDTGRDDFQRAMHLIVEHGLTEAVARAGEREGHVRVEALEGRRVARSADPEVERCAAVGPRLAGRELPADTALLLGGALEIVPELRVRRDGFAPPLDAARGLEPRHRGDEVGAREVVRRRERLAVGAVCRLFRHRRVLAWIRHRADSRRRRAGFPCCCTAIYGRLWQFPPPYPPCGRRFHVG